MQIFRRRYTRTLYHHHSGTKGVSEQENLLRDAAGTIIGGTEGTHKEVSDIWTFVHTPLKPGTKWIVVETRG